MSCISATVKKMLASRLLSILMLLQTRGRMSANDLAREFGVSVRTVHRDVDQLSAAGIPVYAERGRSGGFRLLDGFRTELTGLTQSEAETLFLAGLPGPAAQLGLADILSTASLKLMAALPAAVQPRAQRIAARFHLDPVPWFRGADTLPSLQIIAHAVWSERMLKLRYRRAGQSEAQPRQLAPLGLVLKGGIWYLIAQRARSIRTYRAANIRDAEICDEPFTRPKNFDLAEYWQRSSRDYEAGVYREQADVRVSPKAMHMLELLGPQVTQSAVKTAAKPDRNGWVRCTLPVESIEFGARELLRLGAGVEVIGPPALRAQIAQTVREIAAMYAARPARRRCITV
jgi:predicted DNA-binding transcriptional regulator YafY